MGHSRCFRPRRHRRIFPQFPESGPRFAAAGESVWFVIGGDAAAICKTRVKVRGVQLGRNAERLAVINHAAAVDRANEIKGLVVELAGSGMTTREIAQELTARGIATPLGGRWHPQTVRRAMERI